MKDQDVAKRSKNGLYQEGPCRVLFFSLFLSPSSQPLRSRFHNKHRLCVCVDSCKAFIDHLVSNFNSYNWHNFSPMLPRYPCTGRCGSDLLWQSCITPAIYDTDGDDLRLIQEKPGPRNLDWNQLASLCRGHLTHLHHLVWDNVTRELEYTPSN